jgi:hypothetical protein
LGLTFAVLIETCTFADLEKGNDFVAQLVEHNTFNVGVLGSSPSGITKNHSEKSGFFVCGACKK